MLLEHGPFAVIPSCESNRFRTASNLWSFNHKMTLTACWGFEIWLCSAPKTSLTICIKVSFTHTVLLKPIEPIAHLHIEHDLNGINAWFFQMLHTAHTTTSRCNSQTDLCWIRHWFSKLFEQFTKERKKNFFFFLKENKN